MGMFERYLSVFVALSIAAGVVLGNWAPKMFITMASFEWASVNLVVAILIWVMIYPMMLQVNFSAIKEVHRKPKGLVLTLVVNWMIKPFTMAAMAWLFFKVLFVHLFKHFICFILTGRETGF